LCINFGKKLVGLHFGPFFQNSSVHPEERCQKNFPLLILLTNFILFWPVSINFNQQFRPLFGNVDPFMVNTLVKKIGQENWSKFEAVCMTRLGDRSPCGIVFGCGHCLTTFLI
jgi:hypothetical protein